MFSASLSVVISMHVMRNSHKSIVTNVVYDGVIFGWRLYLFVFSIFDKNDERWVVYIAF